MCRNCLSALGILIVTCVATGRGNGEGPRGAIPDARTEKILKALSSDEIWLDPKKRETLLGHLEAAREVPPSPALGAVLAENIGFSFSISRLNETQWPAFATLKGMGLHAVQPILAEIEKFDPEETEPKTREGFAKRDAEVGRLGFRAFKGAKQRLLIQCLIEIYNEGGHGTELARKRIELEAKGASGKEKERLLKALKLGYFQ